MSKNELNSVTITFNAAEGTKAAVRVNNEDAMPVTGGGSITVPAPAGAVVIFQEEVVRVEDTEALAAHAARVAEQEAAAAKAEADAKLAAEVAKAAGEQQPAQPEQAPVEPEQQETAPVEDAPVEGEVYEVEGEKAVYAKFAGEDGVETFGFLPLAQVPADALAELLEAGKITQADFDAAEGGLKPVEPEAAGSKKGSKK